MKSEKNDNIGTRQRNSQKNNSIYHLQLGTGITIEWNSLLFHDLLLSLSLSAVSGVK